MPDPATHPLPPDAAARAAALGTTASFIVEAPAGSGKTSLLVQRYLKLLAEDDPRTAVDLPEEVLAITFTRKATAEMLDRVLRELLAADQSAPLDHSNALAVETRALAERVLQRSRRLGWGLPAQTQRLNIRSILSVCVELANTRPLLAHGVGPMQPVEDAGPLYREAARQTLLQLGGTDAALDAALRTLLRHRDGSLLNCESLIASMLDTREQWGEILPAEVLRPGPLDDAVLDREVRPRLEQTLAAIVCSGLQRALDALPPPVLHELTALASRLALEPGYNGASSRIAVCHGRNEPPQAVAEHFDHWLALVHLLLTKDGWRKERGITAKNLGFTLPAEHKPQLVALIDTVQSDALLATLQALRCLPPATYPDEQWLVARALFRVLRHALAELKLVFAGRGQCDFSEFSLAAQQVLSAEDPGAASALAAGGTLRHLLVDEMQDTSSGQYELLRLLTQSWDGRSQTLFLVGDPKQSIYLFRQARVERFLRTLDQGRLGANQLLPLRLTTNFRSQAALVAAFNHTFGGTETNHPIFPPPNDPSLRGSEAVDVPFTNADPDPNHPATTVPAIAWHPTIFAVDAPKDDHVQEARAVRRVIEARLSAPLPPGRTQPWRIAVLARARGHLVEIVKALKGGDGLREIPFRGLDLDKLNERQEVLDALALTRALLHPADRIAWLAVLRAPWCGLGRADLLTLTGEGPDADSHATLAQLAATRSHLLSAQSRQLLARVWPALTTAVETLGVSPLSTHVERLWHTLGADAYLSADQQANVLRYFGVLRDLESELGPGRLDIDSLQSRLTNLFAEPQTGEHIQVELLTIHRAKGLEWDLVLVPGLERVPQRSASPLLNWVELDAGDGGASVLLAPIAGKGEDSGQLHKWLTSIQSRRLRAEEKRLFYVACTRAREELHLFAALRMDTSGELCRPAANTLLKACWAAAETPFALAATAPAIQAEPQPLALAAAAQIIPFPSPGPPAQNLQRLPLSFDPAARFTLAETRRLAYPLASALPRTPAFVRPEGSFAVRAFGNVVHRYLQLIAERLAASPSNGLIAELPSWLPRLTASLRGEGLTPAAAAREAARALRALTLTLNDPVGLWLLGPHPESASESSLLAPSASLRFDRTFVAGPAPLSLGESTIWIVDFKTTDPGSRSPEAFAEAQIAAYGPQLQAYAALRRALPGGNRPIRLGLYYPLIPQLIDFEAT